MVFFKFLQAYCKQGIFNFLIKFLKASQVIHTIILIECIFCINVKKISVKKQTPNMNFCYYSAKVNNNFIDAIQASYWIFFAKLYFSQYCDHNFFICLSDDSSSNTSSFKSIINSVSL